MQRSHISTQRLSQFSHQMLTDQRNCIELNSSSLKVLAYDGSLCCTGTGEWGQGRRLTWAWLPGSALIWDEAAHTTVAKAAQLRPGNSATSQLQPSPATTTCKLPREHRSQPKSWGQDEAWSRAVENDLHELHQQKLTWELLFASCQLVHVLKNVPSSTETTTLGSKWERMKKAENSGICSHLNTLGSPSTKVLRVGGAPWMGNDGGSRSSHGTVALRVMFQKQEWWVQISQQCASTLDTKLQLWQSPHTGLQ